MPDQTPRACPNPLPSGWEAFEGEPLPEGACCVQRTTPDSLTVVTAGQSLVALYAPQSTGENLGSAPIGAVTHVLKKTGAIPCTTAELLVFMRDQDKAARLHNRKSETAVEHRGQLWHGGKADSLTEQLDALAEFAGLDSDWRDA